MVQNSCFIDNCVFKEMGKSWDCPFFLRPHPTPPPQIFLVQWKIPEDRLCNVAELWMESKTKTARRFTAKNPWWKNDFLEGGRIKFPKRFCLVGTRYFASATNYWYSIWYYNYGRTWSITSLPGLFFRRRREVFMFLFQSRQFLSTEPLLEI